MLQRPWADPARAPGRQPSAGNPPVPGLPVYQGYGCPHCPYITWTPDSVDKHHRGKHRGQDREWGPGRLSVARARARQQARLANWLVSCQRFYLAQARSYFFKVTCTAIDPAAQGARKQEASQVPVLDPHPTEVSPWLELTWWPEYLRGQDLTMVALLGALPDPHEELLLVQLSASVQRLIDQAYHAIRDGQINEFDQVQINTFFRQPSIWNQPIQIRLQPKTYYHYSQVWQRLLAALDRMEEHGHGLVALAAEPIKPDIPVAATQDIPPPTPPTPNLLPRRTVPWKRREDPAMPLQQRCPGCVGQQDKARGEAELARSYTRVAWQQVFPTRKGSHYIHIQYPDGRQSPPPPVEQAQQAMDAMVITWEQARAQHEQQATIQADKAANTNPWLRMTRWARYLDSVHPQDLRQLVEAPAEEEDAEDRVEQARCSAGIHVEAACTKASQSPHRPLQAYMDKASITKHVQPWQQVLAFITRTQANISHASHTSDPGPRGSQREWLGKLPVYGMTPRQRQTWQAL
ncbi:hypothetical protein BJY01DRAFT_252624 [Aspergillus pseudoustus]|uniref:C2H2-type domain-containing protein n=1 Tax=Aspergillus pseudoustus TaxID=1810923 RepID=A0ABR4J648_9EURO